MDNQNSIIRGILQYDRNTENFKVLYNQKEGYEALIDQPYMDVRLAGTEEWQQWDAYTLEQWLGKIMELRNRTTHVRCLLERVTDSSQVQDRIYAWARYIRSTGGIFDPDTITESGFSYDKEDMHRVVYERPFIVDITYKEIIID